MDKKITKNPTKNRRGIISIAISVAILLSYYLFSDSPTQTLNRNEIVLTDVNVGDFDITVEGYGVLRSKRQKLLTAVNSATIEEIRLKPGSRVEPDSIILRMKNPELTHTYVNAQQELAQEKANLRQVSLTQKKDLLKEQEILSDVVSLYERVHLESTMQSTLAKRGAVSKLTAAKGELETNQLAKKISLVKDRIAQLKLIHKETLTIQSERVKQKEIALGHAKQQLDALEVRASMRGLLQELPVELGQSVTAGQKLALVSSDKELMALVKIPQSQADHVHIGQHTTISLRTDRIKGTVTRVEPAVVEGTVTVEVGLNELLPSTARPELSIDATILVAKLTNTLFIKRPASANPSSSLPLYRLDKTSFIASATTVMLGQSSGKYIQLLSGAALGDTFLASDTSHLDPNEPVKILN